MSEAAERGDALRQRIRWFALHHHYSAAVSWPIIWPLVEQMRLSLVPVFHGLHRRFALER